MEFYESSSHNDINVSNQESDHESQCDDHGDISTDDFSGNNASMPGQEVGSHYDSDDHDHDFDSENGGMHNAVPDDTTDGVIHVVEDDCENEIEESVSGNETEDTESCTGDPTAAPGDCNKKDNVAMAANERTIIDNVQDHCDVNDYELPDEYDIELTTDSNGENNLNNDKIDALVDDSSNCSDDHSESKSVNRPSTANLESNLVPITDISHSEQQDISKVVRLDIFDTLCVLLH